MIIPVQLKQLRPNAIKPKYATEGAAGMDLHACIDSPITLTTGVPSVLIPTGFAAHVADSNVAFFIIPRSGLGHKQGAVLGNGTGLIDSDYQGEIMVSLCVRAGHGPVTINPGDRTAQIVFFPVIKVEFVDVEEFGVITVRGDGGFGSTGVGHGTTNQ